MEELIQKETEAIQKDMHNHISKIKEIYTESAVSYQDLVNVYLIRKIAEISIKSNIKFNDLSSKIKDSYEC